MCQDSQCDSSYAGNELLKKKYLFLERRREGERERNINVWLLLMHPLLVTWPTVQACALPKNQTRDPVVHRPVLSSLNHTSQGGNGLLY